LRSKEGRVAGAGGEAVSAVEDGSWKALKTHFQVKIKGFAVLSEIGCPDIIQPEKVTCWRIIFAILVYHVEVLFANALAILQISITRTG
jgi:hypothetical protein